MTGDALGTRGIVRPAAIPRMFTLDRLPASGDLADLVALHWRVDWALPAGAVHESLVLSYPAVSLSFEADGTWLTGPVSGTYRRLLTGRAHVPALRFRPGAFRSLVALPLSRLRDRVLPVEELLPMPPDLPARVRAAGSLVESRPLVEEWLRSLPRPSASEVDAVVDLVEAERSITRVDVLAERTGWSVRRLQRAFADGVGLPVKQVIRGARLREVAERALDGDVDWAAVAVELGYSDQAHLVRDFTAAVGTPPARYAREARRPSCSFKTAGTGRS
ncbi:MAG TPA: helix-turn-helix domain-containing protein [Geodermatophilus sp.]|nr:helix-turn-helix domain-containing protein [Geodermatophilus sp.]